MQTPCSCGLLPRPWVSSELLLGLARALLGVQACDAANRGASLLGGSSHGCATALVLERWVLPACSTCGRAQTRFETAIKTCLLPGPPSFGCNAQRGFTLPLGRTVQSGANNLQASAQACCTACKATHECTVWSWCFDAQGRHFGTLISIAIHPGGGLSLV